MSSLYHNNSETQQARTENRVTTLEHRRDVSAAFEIKVYADDEEIETGNGKFIFAIPVDLDRATLRYANAYVTTAGSGAIQIQIRNITLGTDVLVAPGITIDSGELNAETSSAPVEIKTTDNFVSYPDTDATVYQRDQIAIDVDAIGSGAMGLGIMLGYE